MAALSPLAVIPGGTSAFVLGKLLAVAMAVVVATFAPPTGRLPRLVVGLLAGGSCLLLAAALASSSPVAALFGRWPRYEGLIALPLYLGAGWLGARLLGPASGARTWRRLHDALSVTSLVMAAVALIELTGARPLGGEGMRSGSLEGNATEMGLLGLVLLAVLAPPALRSRRALLVSGAVGAAALVALSGSRAAYLGALVVVAGLALAGRGVTRRTVALAGAGVATIVAAVLVVPSSRERLLSSGTVTGRLDLWAQAAALVRDHPLWGAGPSGYLDGSVPYVTLEWATEVGMQNPPDSPHMWPLQAASSGGFGLGLLACATALVVTVLGFRTRRRASHDRRAELVGPGLAVLGYGIALLTHFTAAGTTPLVALLAGACLATPAVAATATPVARRSARPARADPAPPPLRRRFGRPANVPPLAWRYAAGMLAVTLTAAVAAEWSVAAALRAMTRGDLDGADSAFALAADLRPWDADVASQATQALAAMASAGLPGAADRCVAWGESALRRVPDSMQAGLAYAVGLRLSGDMAAAREELDRLNSRSPYDPQVLLQRGVLRHATGDVDGARDDLTAALRIEPENAVIQQQLARIEG